MRRLPPGSSEDVPHADVPAPLLAHFTARRPFEVNVGVGVGRQAEVRADAEFTPGAADVVGHANALCTQAGNRIALSLEVMQHGGAGVDEALVLREIEASANAHAADQAVDVVLLDPHALGVEEVVAHDAAPGHFNLRFDKGAARPLEVTAVFGGEAERIVFEAAAGALDAVVRLKPAHLGDEVDEVTALAQPGAVGRQTVSLVVGTAGRHVGGAIRVGERSTCLPAHADVRIGADLNGGILHVDAVVSLFGAVDARPTADAFGTRAKFAHAFHEIVHVVAPLEGGQNGERLHGFNLLVGLPDHGEGAVVLAGCLDSARETAFFKVDLMTELERSSPKMAFAARSPHRS